MDPSPNRLPQSVCSVTAVAFSEVLTPLGFLYVAVELICTSTKPPTLQPNSPYQIAGAVIAGDTNGCPVFHYQPSNIFVTHLCGSALLTSPTQVSAVGKIASVRSDYVVSPLYRKAMIVTATHDCKVSSCLQPPRCQNLHSNFQGATPFSVDYIICAHYTQTPNHL
jgi:hypothetical protein